MTYLGLLLSLLIPVLFVQLKWAYRRRQLLRLSWQGILDRAESVNLDGVREVAESFLQSGSDQSIGTNEMWNLLGGLEGIKRLRSNAKVMLDLCVFAERWNAEDTPVVLEIIRKDAIQLNQAVTRIQITYILGLGFLRAPRYVQEAAASYYLVRSRLFALYQENQGLLMPRLEAAL